MKSLAIFIITFLVLFVPVYAQEQTNPTFTRHLEKIPWFDFNVLARDSTIIELPDIHSVSWQVTLDNDLLYEDPDSSAVLRLYDSEIDGKFIEIGMGGPPDDKFWVAVLLPGEEEYVVVHKKLERGWAPETRVIAAYSDRSGLTVNNGERISVSNVNIGIFEIESYSVHGLEGSDDPLPVYSGLITMEIISGDPAENIFHFFPYFVTGGVALIIAVAVVAKKRSS